MIDSKQKAIRHMEDFETQCDKEVKKRAKGEKVDLRFKYGKLYKDMHKKHMRAIKGQN